jgi:hypothetical protein
MLAIVIPFYKINFFESTLLSLDNQTNKNFNVYIGNDNSTDDPSTVLAKYETKINIKYVEFQNNFGKSSLVKHWERCIEMINDEEWVMILGDDDELSEGVVEMFYNYLNKEINVIRFSSCKINDKSEKISSIYINPIIESSTDFIFRETRSSLSEYIFNKKQIDKIGFKRFPLAWFSDKLAVLEFSNFKDIFSINEAVVYVRISNQSISGIQSNYREKWIATFEFYYYLISSKKNYFTKIQQKKLIEQLSKTYINDKKHPINFLKISKIFLVNLNVLDYLKFIKSIYKSVIN